MNNKKKKQISQYIINLVDNSSLYKMIKTIYTSYLIDEYIRLGEKIFKETHGDGEEHDYTKKRTTKE